MSRSHASLTLLLTVLLFFAGSASGAYVDVASKNHVGVSESNPNIHTYVLGSLELEPQRGDTILGYDLATGVVFYVRQNPWSKFDPLGLSEGLLMGGMDGNDVYGYSTATSPEERQAITQGAQQGAIHGAIAGAVVAGGVAAVAYVAEVGFTAALTALAKEAASEGVDQVVEKATGLPMATSITGLAKDGLQQLTKEGAETGLETAMRNADETTDQVDDILYHYTDAKGAKGIEETKVISPDAKGRVYLTTDKVSPEDASNALFMGQGGSKGTHRVDVKLKDTSGQQLTPGTQQNEIVHDGAIRDPRNSDIEVKENDFGR